MEIVRQYKYPIKPTLDQKEIIIKTFGAVRFVHNRFIDDVNAGKYMKGKAFFILERYRREYPFLKAYDGSALMHAILQAQDTPHLVRYKSRKDSFVSYTTANLPKSPIMVTDDGYICLSRLGKVEMVYHRPLPKGSKIRKATVMRYPDGKYFVSVCISRNMPDISMIPDPEKSIGIDYSSPHFFVDDKGNKVDMPHYYMQIQDRLNRERKKLQNMAFGSRNYYKQKMKLASLYRHEKQQRQDFLHKLSSAMADRYDIICMEDLDMRSISRSYDLGKRTYDNAYGTFRKMLEYKMKERGKTLLYTDRYYPSSKTCHVCGYIIPELKLSERKWECPVCHSLLDRDVNAAINIRDQCLKQLTDRRVSGHRL